MSATEEAETSSMAEEVPAGNPEDISSNQTAIKEAQEEMATLDVLVCGKCHSVFHFVEAFKEHKEGTDCTGKSPVRDSSESKAQVWAFLLWKCSLSREESNSTDSSWNLYQQWCRMAMAQRNSWIAAGTQVQSLSKYAHAKVSEVKSQDQMVPVQQEKKRGRPRKNPKMDDPEYQPSGEEESDTHVTKVKTLAQVRAAQKAKIDLSDKESVRLAQERVPPEERIARRTEEGADPADGGDFVVEKILAKRFNPRKKLYEYLLKWEGYPHEQNTWEPVDNMATCKALLDAFEKQLARQKELKALKAQQQQKIQVKQVSTPLISSQVVRKVKTDTSSPQLTPSGRLQRSSKARALDQVKQWCGAAGADDEPAAKRLRKDSSDDDFSDTSFKAERRINGDSPAKKQVDPEIVKNLGLGGKGMPNIKGVIKVDPKHMPDLTTGVYIMSKNTGIVKIDSAGKMGPGLNIDQDVIRKQIMAAKQKKLEETKKASPLRTPVATQVKKTLGSGSSTPQQVTEKTIITPSGQKIIQRTIQRAMPGDARSPVAILNKRLAQHDTTITRRGGAAGGAAGRGRGGGRPSILQRQPAPVHFPDMHWDQSSDTSDGIEDPFPTDLGPLPSPSPERELTLDPETGKRLARAEGEPTPPPTPSPPPTPPPQEPVMMKVEMSPGGTTGMLVRGDAPSLPLLDDDATQVKVEASTVKQLLEEGGVGDEGGLLHAQHPPIMIRGEDGVLYQVAGENEAGQTLLVAAEGVEGAVEGVEAAAEGEGEGVVYVTREDGQQDVLSIDPSQLAGLMGAGAGLQQVAVQVEGEGDESTQVVAQLVQADLPSPGGTRRVVLLLPDGSFTMTELDKEQYESITEAGRQD